jgi:hypothetical protein
LSFEVMLRGTLCILSPSEYVTIIVMTVYIDKYQ